MIQERENCEDCLGLGEVPTTFFRDGTPSHYQVCIECRGTGERQPWRAQEAMLDDRECPL